MGKSDLGLVGRFKLEEVKIGRCLRGEGDDDFEVLITGVGLFDLVRDGPKELFPVGGNHLERESPGVCGGGGGGDEAN